jgi:TRAP-type mannitol/chloroaromatic compound transport system substrate-binding protein
MERRSFVKQAGLAGILAAGAAPAVVAQQSIRWRLASSFPNSLDTIFGAANVFAQRVKEATNGKFEITVHAGGELVPPFGVVDAVQQGTVECCHTAPYYFVGKDPTFALDCAVPFGMNARQTMAWMYQGNGLKLTREFYTQYNIVNFPMGNTGAQMGGWFRKPIHSLADMKGLKMRISSFAGKVMERLGVVPQNIPGGDIYPSLEKGTIDAAEWVGPYDDLKLGFYKVAKNYVYPGWWEGGPQLSLYVNTKAWNALPADYKAIVEVAAANANINMLAAYDAKNPNALRELVGRGVKLQPFPKDVMEAAYKATQDIFADLSRTNANWKKIYPDWVKFRNDDILWFRIAENEFDRFMFTRKLA